jgi:hypothetical protein
LAQLTHFNPDLVVERGTLAVPFINKRLGNNEEIIDTEMRFNIEYLLNALFQEIINNFVG